MQVYYYSIIASFNHHLPSKNIVRNVRVFGQISDHLIVLFTWEYDRMSSEV